MKSQRLSLSSSVFTDRIKKFDTYQHNARTSKRVTLQPKSTSSIIQPQVPNKLAVKHKDNKHPMPNVVKKHSAQYTRTHSVSAPTHLLALGAVAKSQAVNKSVISNQFEWSRHSAEFNKKKSKWQVAFYSLGIGVFMLAAGASIQTLLTNSNARAQIEVLGEQTQTTDEQGVVEGTGSEPSESEVPANAIASYNVNNPELPRYLRIPELGVFSRIKHLGEDGTGAVDAPKNIHDVGWYTGSARPGNVNGSSLLLGHVSGWTGPGVFKNIDKLNPGSRFEVEKGSGEKITYEVTYLRSIPLDEIDMGKILSMEVPGEHDLKLMTCSGKYNRDTKTYEERMVVYAKVLR